MNKQTSWTIAITGMNALPENPAAGISVARCLKNAFGDRVRIIGLGYDAFDAGLYINDCCDAAYLIPYPRFGSEALLLRLQEIHQMEAIDALIPCLDTELLGIISIADSLLALGIKTYLPQKEQLLRCSKNALPDLAKIVGINYPEIKSLLSPDFFYVCNYEGWTYPLVVKGIFCDARIVFTPDEAVEAFHDIAKDWGLPILMQRHIRGEECNLTAIGDGAGSMIGEVMMRKVALTSKNKACVGVTTEDPVLINTARAIIKELNWKGPFELEVICDEQGTYHLIELNPRFPAWILLSDKAGRNLPALLLELLFNLNKKPLNPPIIGTYFIRYAAEQMVYLNQIGSMVTQGSSACTIKEHV